MKSLIDHTPGITVAQLAEALSKVENQGLPVRVWDNYNVCELYITDIEYGDAGPLGGETVWINVSLGGEE